ncbi:uncharacterized protein LOC118491181 isoform X1 [Helianthus annuus]|uniref:uncharacterized protein LOC118491181 isoform X1 n=1 Tax=Helianthus annuus TaxID=4232 RepID=UPI001652DDBC|nr:uncharacterized protein LOC118491181 isoform X1 [Helianthus annuus]
MYSSRAYHHISLLTFLLITFLPARACFPRSQPLFPSLRIRSSKGTIKFDLEWILSFVQSSALVKQETPAVSAPKSRALPLRLNKKRKDPEVMDLEAFENMGPVEITKKIQTIQSLALSRILLCHDERLHVKN